MPRILSNCYPDGFLSTSGANKHSGEFLLNNADYSASSSPHWLRLYRTMGQDSIFTFGSRLLDKALAAHTTSLASGSRRPRPEISNPHPAPILNRRNSLAHFQ